MKSMLLCAILLWAATDMLAQTDSLDVDRSNSSIRPLIERYGTDQITLSRVYASEMSPLWQERMQKVHREWLERLSKLNFESLTQESKIDYVLFRNTVEYDARQLELQKVRERELAHLLPFTAAIVNLEDTRRGMKWIEGKAAAESLESLTKQINAIRKSVESELRAGSMKKTSAGQAVTALLSLRATLRHWYDFYNGYDPLFTWWAAEPFKTADAALLGYVTFFREKVLGLRAAAEEAPAAPGGRRGGAPRAAAQAGDTSDIIGIPIGRDGLMSELRHEMIPYTPEELIAIANKEFKWCEGEMKRASAELGYGDDWQKALEHVKNKYVEPGKQTTLIHQLADEAVEFLEKNNLVTIPELSKQSWRIEMMSPERQLVNPFFTGGELITVSYPTSGMTHEQKLMSMRGNNPHFSRATVFHELIPGHHLQGHMSARYHTYRAAFRTPFYVEGWALYWELLLWDMNFGKTPEDRIGMLFWRMHRCARIIFSLNFHMEKMTPQECIDFLVQRVGHERENAVGEVRRSFDGSYRPLYQAAYLLGGMQLFQLHKELVGSGKMTNRAFHDAVLKENSMPIEMVRAALTNQKLNPNFEPVWKFRGADPLSDR